MASANAAADLKPMTVYSHGMGPNPKKVLIILEALKIPYTEIAMEFGDGPGGVKHPDFLKINPNGRVPALVDPNQNDLVVWESGAILLYLEKFYDKGNTLGGKDIAEQVEINEWLFFQVSGVGPAQGQCNWFLHYNGSENANALERYQKEAVRCWSVVDAKLGANSKYICCDKFTITDAAFYSWAVLADFAQITLPPNVKRWADHMATLDYVKAVYQPKA